MWPPGITKMGITELTVAVWPWLLSMLVFLGVVTYWPALSLWFPADAGRDVSPVAAAWGAGRSPGRFAPLPR